MIPDWIVTLIMHWIIKNKTGSITINFFEGGITNVVKKESIKK